MLGSTTGSGDTPSPGPAGHTDTADDITLARYTLIDAGFTDDEAIRCLEALSVAGFMVVRPQTMLDRLVDAAVNAATEAGR